MAVDEYEFTIILSIIDFILTERYGNALASTQVKMGMLLSVSIDLLLPTSPSIIHFKDKNYPYSSNKTNFQSDQQWIIVSK